MATSSPSSLVASVNSTNRVTVTVYDNNNSTIYTDVYIDYWDAYKSTNDGWEGWIDWASVSGTSGSFGINWDNAPWSNQGSVRFRARLRNRNNISDISGWTYSSFVDKRIITPAPNTPIDLSTYGITGTSVHLTCYAYQYTTSLQYRVYTSGGTLVKTDTVSTISGYNETVITGLTEGTNYYFRVMASGTGGSSSWSGSYYFTTSPPAPSPPSVTSTASDDSSITIYFNRGTNASETEFYLNGSYITSEYVGGNNYFYVSGLTPNTSYSYRLRSHSSSTGLYSNTDATGTIKTKPRTRPDNFGWSTTKTSGGTFKLTASEWNSFTSRINAFRLYKGLTSYSFTTAVYGNDFTATIMNQAIDAINDMVNLSVYSKSRGDAIYALDLNRMVTALNSIT